MKFIAIKIVKFTSVMDVLAYKEKKNNHSIFLKCLYFPKYLNSFLFLKEINIILKKGPIIVSFNKNNAIVFRVIFSLIWTKCYKYRFLLFHQDIRKPSRTPPPQVKTILNAFMI